MQFQGVLLFGRALGPCLCSAFVALAHWRQAARYVKKIKILRKLFEEIAPHYLERNGGYTRIIRLGTRLGDNAQQVMLELVDTEVTLKPVASGKVDPEAKGDGSGKKKKDAPPKGKGRTKAKPKSKTKAKSKAKPKSKPKSKSKSKAKAKK